MHAVTGATGQLGRLVLEILRDRYPDQEIVALARDPGKAGDLGVKVREADYSRPETLASALAGVERLLLISSNEVGQRAAQHRNVIEAAKQAGVGHIVYTSLLHADTSPLSLAEEHRQTEAALQASGIPHTVLRNGWYTENHTGALGGAVAGGALIGSAGSGRISGATRADFAEAAALVLVGGERDGEILELAGDTAFTLSDLAAEVSRQTGRQIAYRDLPPDEYAAQLEGFGVPKALAASIAGWDADASGDALFDDSGTLGALIGRPTTPLADAVAAALAAMK